MTTINQPSPSFGMAFKFKTQEVKDAVNALPEAKHNEVIKKMLDVGAVTESNGTDYIAHTLLPDGHFMGKLSDKLGIIKEYPANENISSNISPSPQNSILGKLSKEIATKREGQAIGVDKFEVVEKSKAHYTPRGLYFKASI